MRETSCMAILEMNVPERGVSRYRKRGLPWSLHLPSLGLRARPTGCLREAPSLPLPWQGLQASLLHHLGYTYFLFTSHQILSVAAADRELLEAGPGQAHIQGLSNAHGLIGWNWILRVPMQGLLLILLGKFIPFGCLSSSFWRHCQKILATGPSACTGPSFTRQLPAYLLQNAAPAQSLLLPILSIAVVSNVKKKKVSTEPSFSMKLQCIKQKVRRQYRVIKHLDSGIIKIWFKSRVCLIYNFREVVSWLWASLSLPVKWEC